METIAAEPATRPLRRDAERNRRRILDAAATVFAEHGLGASLDDIADEAEVGVGTVYRRFPNKELLIDALFDEQVASIVALAEAALAIEDPWDGLEHFMRSALERQAANRGLKELILGARMGRGTGCTAEGRTRIEPLVRRLVERAQADGSLRDDLDTTDMPLIQMMVGSVADYTRSVDPEVWQRLLTVVLDGLRAKPDVRTPMPTAPLDSAGLTAAMSGWQPPRG
ncbi:TetR/AcrR family transcriptional regulator [Solirubrobacter phytolaccae]|uniref:TetR/AcrR family transcriptional regulator n=1 Tax=Solirubrobacter phytolaccae TaxID=1404360 RepID=A0A9X3NN99_9ACTN|nr:TetR/AcrR family transcriptional regulator [Solirubrobacter phytolaccae]MDA0184512.1 TetR/AcrR family transcriptional regulator [Solirubrobacter phytolaccae]